MAVAQQDSRNCILAVAAKLFAKLGLDKCSTREIAKLSNSNISLISYYFGGKEGLYREVMRSCALEISEHVLGRSGTLKDQPMTEKHFRQEVEAVVESIIFFRTKYPEVSQIFAREKLTNLQHSKEIHQEIFYPLVQSFIETIERAQKAGFVRKDINPALFFSLMSEGIWGFFEMQSCPIPMAKEFSEFAKNPTKLKNQIAKIFIEGAMT